MRSIASYSALTLLLLTSATNAQTLTQPTTEKALWEAHLNVQQLFASPLGTMINEIIHKEAPDGKLNVDAFIEAIGFDPRTDVTEVVVYGDDFEKPNLTAVANLKSRGNIEGWLLAAPGYKSEPIDDNTLMHSFVVEKDDIPRLWCAIPRKKSGDSYVLVAGFSSDKVRALTAQVAGQADASLSTQLTGGTFLSLSVSDLSKAPIEIDEDEPGSGIIKTLKSVALSAASEQNNLVVTGEISTDNAARAQQLHQLIVGMKAMVQLALPEKDPDGERLAKLLTNLNVEYAEGSTSLSTKFAIDYDELLELIEMKHKR